MTVCGTGRKRPPYRTSPCPECPWRTDVPVGKFPPERFLALAPTAYDMSATQFACHMSQEGREQGCAGFVLRGADHNLGFRLAARHGKLDPDAVRSDHPLYRDYREMAEANGVDPDDPVLVPCRSPSR
jgi:hypothetical protein